MRPLENLLGSLRTCLETFPDGRRGANGQYSMADFGMSAFSVFFMQSPSFLAHQRRLEEGHGRSNCQSLFGMGKIPSDNRIRDMLDPASPELLNPVFYEITSQLCQAKGARRGGAATERRNIFTLCWGQCWLRPAMIRLSRFRRNLLCPRTARRNRTAQTKQPNAGWPAMVRATPRWTRSILA